MRSLPFTSLTLNSSRRIALRLLAIFALALPTTALAATSGNLLRNGDAETHRCTRDWSAQTPVPGWRVLRGAASVLCYSAFASTGETPHFPRQRGPDAATAGRALFAAPGADTVLQQTVDLAAAQAAIDAGQMRFTLSGWLGGARDYSEGAVLTAVFLDEAHRAIGSPSVLSGHVGPSGPGEQQRRKSAGLAQHSAEGTVPTAARHIVVTLQFPSRMSSFHDAYADNIDLRLHSDDARELLPVGRSSAPPLAPPSAIPTLDHVVVVMMENTNYADVVDLDSKPATITPRMPFLAGLAQQGALLTNMWANYHPSDQNYVAMVAGDTFKSGPVYYPDYHLKDSHLGDLIEARGKTWRAYVQHMKTPCNLRTDAPGQGHYAPDDQPFAHFVNVIQQPARCKASLRDLQDFDADLAADRLPDFAWIAADGWWDGEGAWEDNFDMGYSLGRQDVFLASTFKALLASPQWQASRSLLIITWDESLGWGWPDNHIPTVLVASPGLLREGAVIDTHYDGYSVLRTVEAGLGLDDLGRFDRFANPLNEAFADGSRQGSARDTLSISASTTLATRGSLDETFGQVATPVAVVQGQVIELHLQGPASGAAGESATAGVEVLLAPLGQSPEPHGASVSTTVNATLSTTVSIPSSQLRPGRYSVWWRPARQHPGNSPADLQLAPLMLTVLPPPTVSPDAPGVEIVNSRRATAAEPAQVRQGANVIVRYCRPPDANAQDTWIGIFAAGTPAARKTKGLANEDGNWLKTPGTQGKAGTPDSPCGEAMAYAAKLKPGVRYRVQMFNAPEFSTRGHGAAVPVGREAAFRLTPTGRQ